MNRLMVLFFGAAAIAVLVVLLRPSEPPLLGAEIVSLQALQSAEGFARAERMRSFTFPDDHGPHPEYQTEWWYYTGNLQAQDGRLFGYQFTLFRRAIAPREAARTSEWATNQIYFAHFALTDVTANRHYSAERFSRGAAGLAGATGAPYHVWVENWQVASLAADGSRVRLQAEDSGRALDLTLAAQKPLVLHGDGGLSLKSSAPGNASYYVSFTRLDTVGILTISGQALPVTGLSWMDHEFGTTSLGAGAVGWDWFSVQLSDGREVMFFQIRKQDGTIEPLSSGTLVEPDGSTRHLAQEAVSIEATGRWTSAAMGATYPAGWTLLIPGDGTTLTLRPRVADQEMRVSIVYWEGAVAAEGISRGAPVTGHGYVELTGYAAPMAR